MLRSGIAKHHRGATVSFQRLRAFQAQALRRALPSTSAGFRQFSSSADDEEFLLPHEIEARKRLRAQAQSRAAPAPQVPEQPAQTPTPATPVAGEGSSPISEPKESLFDQISAQVMPEIDSAAKSESASSPSPALEPPAAAVKESTPQPKVQPKPSFTIRKVASGNDDDFLLPHQRLAREKLAKAREALNPSSHPGPDSEPRRVEPATPVESKPVAQEQPPVASTPVTPADPQPPSKPAFTIRKTSDDEFLLPHKILARGRQAASEITPKLEEVVKPEAPIHAPASISAKPAFTVEKVAIADDEFILPQQREAIQKLGKAPEPTASEPEVQKPPVKPLFAPKFGNLSAKDDDFLLPKHKQAMDKLRKAPEPTPAAEALPQKSKFAIRSAAASDDFLLPTQRAAMEKLKKVAEAPVQPPPGNKFGGFNIRKTSINDDFMLPHQKAAHLKLLNSSNRKLGQSGSDDQSRIDKFSNLLNNLTQQRQQTDSVNDRRQNQGRQEGGVWGSLMRRQGRDRDQDKGQERGREGGQERGQGRDQERGQGWVSRQNRNQGERYSDEARASRRENYKAKPAGLDALGIEVEVDTALTEETAPQGGSDSSHKKAKNAREEEEEDVDEDKSKRYDRTPKKDDKKKKKRGDVDRERDRKSTRPSRSSYEEDPDEAAWDAEDERMFEERRRRKAQRKAEKEAAKRAAAEAEAEAAKPKTIYLPEFINVSSLAQPLAVKVDEFLEILLEYGFEDMTEDTIMTGETAALIAQEFGFEAIVDDGQARDVRPRPPPEDPSILPQRPPVVTIMGHVDHGKTTLLDWLRKSSIAAQEHGGITQHIGAFVVKMQTGKQITFLDTPGHAAFLSMRKRGASATDIVVLVVAADDSVMPQTIEALKHAREAQVPIIVAITKCDKPEAQLDMVKNDLSRHGVEIEDYGGDVQVVPVSGKTGLGMDALEENIITLAEILDMRAEADGMAEGWVLEANVKSIGKAATVLVKRGTLRIGDCIVAGRTWARVRALRDEFGDDITEAPPGTPVEVLGWKELPQSGDQMIQAPDENTARNAVDYRVEMKEREESQSQLAESERKKRELAEAEAAKKAAEEAGDEAAEEAKGPKTVNFIVRGDVVGSVEAVSATILEIGNHEVQPRILRQAAGNITESDVEYAAASGSVIISFNNTALGHIKRLAADQGVRVVEHSVIYTVADSVKAILSEKLEPKITFKVNGEAEVSKIFSINVKRRIYKNIAGCKVRNGVIKRNDIVRVIRRGEQIFQGTMSELKQVKRDVMEMRVGTECGISIEGFEDFEEGDIIQTCEEVRTKRHL